jgi:glycosyltransferase involved in cell wall biosynthesis
MIQISVIVPVFNSARWLERCIESLLSQDYNPNRYEVILVDNNSTDGSAAIVRRFDRIQLLRESRQGSYAARNTGVRNATGQWLAFTDADCAPDANWLSAIDSAMRNPQTQVVLGSRRLGPESNELRLLGAYEDARVAHIVSTRHRSAYFAYTNNMSVRREGFERYGPFDEVDRAGDTLFLQRLAKDQGADAVAWSPEMRITHLELASAWTYLRKNYLYARARRQTEHIGQYESIRVQESFEIFKRVCAGRTMAEGVKLAAVLAAGRAVWLAGSLRP